jgi:tetratricopeptide (TPR) repeat protein
MARMAWQIVIIGALLGAGASAAEPANDTPEILRLLVSKNPADALQRLNDGAFEAIIAFNGVEIADDLAVEAIAAAGRDTWPIEQLQRRRIQTMLRAGKKAEALSAAKALFLVSGIGSTAYCIQQLCECIEETDPRRRAAVNLFKLQQLGLAHSDPEVRKKQSADLGQNLLAAIPIDPKPFAKAVEDLKDQNTYDAQYARGNLLLLSGRVAEARGAFERAYELAPPGELRYASEGLAKVIKAEDLSIGRMNEFILSLRPRQ